jgi:hypothetical protein
MDTKPSRNEDEYFAKQDAELLKAQRAKLDAERAAAQKNTHKMKCPKCGSDLQEQELASGQVDVFPNCNGMWLDAGELELVGRVRNSAIGGVHTDIMKGLPGK